MNKDNFVQYLSFLAQQHGSQRAAAQAWGISAPYLTDVLKGRREPGAKLLQALGIRKEVTYVEDLPPQRLPGAPVRGRRLDARPSDIRIVDDMEEQREGRGGDGSLKD